MIRRFVIDFGQSLAEHCPIADIVRQPKYFFPATCWDSDFLLKVLVVCCWIENFLASIFETQRKSVEKSQMNIWKILNISVKIKKINKHREILHQPKHFFSNTILFFGSRSRVSVRKRANWRLARLRFLHFEPILSPELLIHGMLHWILMKYPCAHFLRQDFLAITWQNCE